MSKVDSSLRQVHARVETERVAAASGPPEPESHPLPAESSAVNFNPAAAVKTPHHGRPMGPLRKMLTTFALAMTMVPGLGAGLAMAQDVASTPPQVTTVATPANTTVLTGAPVSPGQVKKDTKVEDGNDDPEDIKPFNENGAFLHLEFDRRWNLVNPIVEQKYNLGANTHAMWEIGGATFSTRNYIDLSQWGMDKNGVLGNEPFTPAIISNDIGRFNLFRADIHTDFKPWDGASFTFGGSVQADGKEQFKIDPMWQSEQPAPSKPKPGAPPPSPYAAVNPALFLHQESLEGVGSIYLKGKTETNIGTFGLDARAQLQTFAWSEGDMTRVPQVSPRFSVRESFKPSGTELKIELQQDWRPAEQFTRYAIQATHPLPTGKIKSDIGVYAGEQWSLGKKSEFVGAGITFHF